MKDVPIYITQNMLNINFELTISDILFLKVVETRLSLHMQDSPIVLSGGEDGRHLHRCMEHNIKGVRYRVYSSFSGDASFRELYEKCLASRLLRLHGECCAEDAAGD